MEWIWVVLVQEVEVKAEDAFSAIITQLAGLAIKRRVGDIKLFLTPEHPFAEFCQRHGCRWSITYHKNAGAMMRIVNQEPLFKALASELGRRLRHSRFRNHSGSLRFKTDLGMTTLQINKGSVKLVPNLRGRAGVDLTQGQLTQLVAGYRSVRDVLSETGIKGGAKVELLLAVLFPKQTACIRNWPRFEELYLNPEDF